MKVALVHDWLTGRRGGEKVLEVFAELFPEADIYTLFHFKGSQHPSIESRKIYVSFLQKFPFIKSHYRYYLPIFPIAIESFNLNDYELIISTSHCVAKGAISSPEAVHLCYCFTPMRYVWDLFHYYFGKGKISSCKRALIHPIISYLRVWDVSSSFRVHSFASDSNYVAERIRKYYGREAKVIHAPVDTDFFNIGDENGEYFLIVSALVPYKKIDLAIEVFNRRKERLLIVGKGPEYKKLKKMASSNIEFLGSVSDEVLLRLYQNAKAFILPGIEDFGIAPLEAQACGVPVIALKRGGALETVKERETGIFFNDITPDSFNDAIDRFQNMKFNKFEIRKWAEKFSYQNFRDKIKEWIEKEISEMKRR
ncbi:MAG: glycosyltransferase [Candidatus Aminicenantia bacterium]